MLYISDNEGKDLIWDAQAKQKDRIFFTPTNPIALARGTKLILEYTNTDTVEVSTRFLWRT